MKDSKNEGTERRSEGQKLVLQIQLQYYWTPLSDLTEQKLVLFMFE